MFIEKWTKLKRWAVVQKITLIRGYGWTQVPFMGFLGASQLKLLFPALFDGLFIYAILIIVTMIGFWLIGYMDKKMLLLHAENAYGTETNPIMMEMANSLKEQK